MVIRKSCSSVPGYTLGCPQVREVVCVKSLASAQSDVDFPGNYLDAWFCENLSKLVAGRRTEKRWESELTGSLTACWAGCCSSGLSVRMGSQEPGSIGSRAPRLPFIWDFPCSLLRIMQPSGILIRNLSKLFDNFSNLLEFLFFLPNGNENKLEY